MPLPAKVVKIRRAVKRTWYDFGMKQYIDRMLRSFMISLERTSMANGPGAQHAEIVLR